MASVCNSMKACHCIAGSVCDGSNCINVQMEDHPHHGASAAMVLHPAIYVFAQAALDEHGKIVTHDS